MKLSSRDAIIKKQAVTINTSPKQLKASSHFSQHGQGLGRQEAGGMAEADDAAFHKAFAETLTDAAETETQAQGGVPAGAGAYGGAQAGAVPAEPAFSGDNSAGVWPAGHEENTVPAGAVPGKTGMYPAPAGRTGSAAQAEAGTILAAAREEAAALIRDARAQAEAIISEARQQEESLREALLESLLRERLPQALEEGRANGRQQGLQELADTIGKVQAFYQMLERAWHDELAKIDEDLLDLALKISERMVGTVLKYDKEKLLSMIRSLILLPNERRNLKIHVSDPDWEWLRNLQDKGLPPYPLIRDEGLQPGNVLIQSSEGIFDAQLDTQLEKFREVLSEELINGQLESFS